MYCPSPNIYYVYINAHTYSIYIYIYNYFFLYLFITFYSRARDLFILKNLGGYSTILQNNISGIPSPSQDFEHTVYILKIFTSIFSIHIFYIINKYINITYFSEINTSMCVYLYKHSKYTQYTYYLNNMFDSTKINTINNSINQYICIPSCL